MNLASAVRVRCYERIAILTQAEVACTHVASEAEDASVALWDLDSMACGRTCTHMDSVVRPSSSSRNYDGGMLC